MLKDDGKPDAGLRKILHDNLPGHWTTIETGAVAQGVPDSNYCLNGVEGWVECKRSHSYGIVGMRPGQCAWLFKRWFAGGNCWVAVRVLHEGGVRKGPPEDTLCLVKGLYAPDLKRAGLSSVPYLSWAGSPTGWSWEEIADCLGTPRKWDPADPGL